MEQIVIIHKNGDTLPLFSKSNLTAVTRAAQKTALLSEDKVVISVQAAMPLDLAIGDEAVIYGKKYRINQLPQVTKNGERRYQYEITLEGAQYELLDINYQLHEDSYGENFYADLKGHLDILLWNIQRVIPNKWKLGAYPTETEYKNINTSGKNCLQVLQELCTSYGVEFETVCSDGKVNTLNIKEKVGSNLSLTLRYGRGRGLYQLQRSTVNNSSIVNRLYVYGSSDNLPEGYNHTKLRLPSSTRLTSYVEDAASIAAYGVKEGMKTYDTIKPERVGTITAVGADKLTFVDSSMDFDLNEKKEDGSTRYLIADTAAKIKFETGQLAGYEFDLHSYDHATKTFVINAFTDENKNVFPSDGETFRFAKGDKYAIFDINLPQSYIDNAQNRLKEEALKYLPTVSQPQVTYKLQLTDNFLGRATGSENIETIFHVGDFIHIIDEQVGVDKEVRIVSLERNCLKLHTYDITLSDTVQRSTTVKVINDVEALNEVIRINNLADPNKARANWKSSREVLDMVFDQDGDYYTDKIKPLSIDTTMLSVGAKASQFCLLGTTIAANYGGDANKVQVTGGILQHYTISEDGVRSWTLADVEVTLGDATKAYYIYARCNREDSEGAVVFSTEQHAVEGDASYYYFLFGIINSKDSTLNVRTVYLSYGFTTINGRFVRTGRIESSGGGSCYFDLDNNEIGGVIKFVNSKGEYVNVADVEALAADTDKYINSTLQSILGGFATQIDGKIETYYTTVDPSAAWKTDAERAKHVGDLWFNTETKESKRYSESYAWVIIEDKDAIDALEAAANAQDTADGKRRVFVDTPYPPYDVGDLWTDGKDLFRCNNARQEGEYVATDWGKATSYTDDSTLLNFIQKVYLPDKHTAEEQLDGKIETWFTITDPSVNWLSNEEKYKHNGDLWYNSNTKTLKRWGMPRTWHQNAQGLGFYTYGVGKWADIEDQKAIDAYAAAAAAQDTADGKRQVFVDTPYPPYDIGDLWLTGGATDGQLKRCVTAKAEGEEYNANDWVIAVYYDNTKTTIDGGIVTSGTVQLAGSDQSIKAGITGEGTADSSVRVWAGASKENRATAPFRVLQNGELYATKAHIEGEINATSGKFSGEVNATSGTFYGSLATPPKAIPDNTTTLVLDFKEGFNFAGTLTGSSNVKTIQLPMDAKYAGVQCSIINYGGSSNGCFRVRASSSSYPLLYSGRLSNRRTVNYVDLYGCAEIRLKAITVSDNVRWFIENHNDFSYDVQNSCLTNNLPSSISRVIGSYWVNAQGNITKRMCADNNPVEWVGYTGDGCFRFKFKKQRTSGLDYTLIVRNESATNIPYRITEKGDTYFTISIYFEYLTPWGITPAYTSAGGWGFDIFEYDK